MEQDYAPAALEPELVESLRAEVERCAKCGQCRSVCPVFAETGDEGDVARGRISLVEALLDGRLGCTRRLRESFQSCLDCARCDADCPTGVGHELVLHAVRRGIALEVGVPWAARFSFRCLLPRRRLFEWALRIAAVAQRLLRRRRAGATRATQRSAASQSSIRHLPLFLTAPWAWRPGAGLGRIPPLARQTALRKHRPTLRVANAKGRVAVFAGCLINAVYPEVADDLVAVLNRIGYDVVLPPGQVCCGTPALSYGDVESARGLARINRRALAESAAETVVAPCAACGHALKSTYARLLGQDWTSGRFAVWDASEFLSRQNLGALSPLRRKITYHDPCRLRWGQKIHEAPRALLRRCGEYVEMSGAERCCGGGGAFSLFHRDIAVRIAERKVRAIAASGAEVVATDCPGCLLMLSEQLAAGGCGARMLHTVQVLRNAMG
jgi:glycolate oxidase iron-sulfur subunit